MKPEAGGQRAVIPKWQYSLDYEFDVRKLAINISRERGLPIGRVLWTVCADGEHRMTNWIRCVVSTNVEPSEAQSEEIKALRLSISHKSAQINQLRNAFKLTNRDRSRPPRGGPPRGGGAALPGPAQLALPAPSLAAGGRGKST